MNMPNFGFQRLLLVHIESKISWDLRTLLCKQFFILKYFQVIFFLLSLESYNGLTILLLSHFITLKIFWELFLLFFVIRFLDFVFLRFVLSSFVNFDAVLPVWLLIFTLLIDYSIYLFYNNCLNSRYMLNNFFYVCQ